MNGRPGDRNLRQRGLECGRVTRARCDRDRAQSSAPSASACACRPVKRAKRAAASLDIGDHDHDAREPARAVGMREPARLPHRVLGVMRQHLDAAFRHLAALDARDREGGGRGPASVSTGRCMSTSGRMRKAGSAEPRDAPCRHRRPRRPRDARRHSAPWRRSNSCRKRRVGGLEQHLHIAARQHGADIAGAGRRAVRD